MTTKSPAQLKADRKYDAKRPAPVPVRLSEVELALLDKARGEMGRGAYLRQLLLKSVGGSGDGV